MRQVLVPRDLAPVMPLRAPGASIVSLGGETMGTTWSVKLVQPASVSTAALCGGLERRACEYRLRDEHVDRRLQYQPVQ